MIVRRFEESEILSVLWSIHHLHQEGHQISAIKLMRLFSGFPLVTSKMLVESMANDSRNIGGVLAAIVEAHREVAET
jgi:hypothetical protein